MAMTDEAGVDDEQRAPWRLTAVGGAQLILLVTGVALRLTGVIGEVGLWRMLAVSLVVTWLIMFWMLRQHEHELASWTDLAEKQHALLSSIRAMPSVRCAGCHMAAALLGEPGTTEDGQPGMLAPPGWDMRDDRPYCPACLAKS